jgi:Uma2 family endonuclease
MNTRMKTAAPELDGEPVWDIAYLFPNQGEWSEEEYLALDTNHLVEYSDGSLEVLSLPTPAHQFVVAYLYYALYAFIMEHRLGVVLFAPLRVRLKPKKYREPDLVFVSSEHQHRLKKGYWAGADLVMEVVSESAEDRERDLVTKRNEYAEAGISEYWIVDPVKDQITVLRLSGKRYFTHGEFRPSERATSALLPGFAVEGAAVFAAVK